MTTILPANRTAFDALGEMLGGQISQNLGPALEKQGERARNIEAVDQAERDIKAAGNDPFKIILAITKAGANNPNLQRSLGPLAESAMKAIQLQNEGKVKGASEIGGPRQHEVPEPFQRGAPIGENAATNKFFPTNQPLGEETGNLPQAATTNKVLPLRTPAQIDQDEVKLLQDAKKNGIPMTRAEARSKILEDEQQKVRYNEQVGSEQKERIGAQRDYGKLGEEKLLEVHKNATPEQIAIFKRKAEEAAAQGQSEAAIERSLATEAKNFGDTIKNVQNDMKAERVVESFKRKFMGSKKEFESAAKDLRVKLKPLLDLGLYDTARDLVTDLEYYPEERDEIINPMGEREKSVLNRVPTLKTARHPTIAGLPALLPSQKNTIAKPQDVKDGIMDLKKANPNFSLVLARKAFEEKGYDWRVFKDALNDMVLNGEMKLEDDQQKQLINLDQPPLNTLDKILEGINIIGR